MIAIRGRFRTSRLARTVYVGAILALSAVWAFLELSRAVKEPHTVGASARRLLSGGVEIIPGFTGAKCGSNWYYKVTDATGKTHTHKVEKDSDNWKKAQALKLNPSAYAQWEADSGGIVYVILSIYLFLGIAIICDGHFVDSLDMICSRYGLDLPPDVAGATFMAAGSSAPELATSFLGVFVAESAVGLGTILGSAVFNILIIVGAVAILTGEPLKLDYRPVIRDNFFYAVSVVLLCILLAVDDQANLVDTILLLLWYSAYITFLYFNDYLIAMILPVPEDEEEEEEGTEMKPVTEVGALQSSGDAKSDLPPTMGSPVSEGDGAKPGEEQPKGSGSGKEEEDEYRQAWEGMGYSVDQEVDSKDIGEAIIALGSPFDEMVDLEDEQWNSGTIDYTAFCSYDVPMDERPVDLETARALAANSKAADGTADTAMVEVDLGKTSGNGEGNGAEAEDDGEKEGKKQRRPSFSTGKFKQEEGGSSLCCCGPTEEEEDPDADPPTMMDKVLSFFSTPFEFIFNYTMPNCHIELDDDEEDEWREKYDAASPEEKKKMKADAWETLKPGQRWYWLTFFISLLHITWLSYFMVEFMLKIGCLWGIPDVVMGLTFLAMGTSIPDALGSVSVAQDGEGDMAVSNAVGSNVFDICIGLGLPWFIKLAGEAGNECNYIPIFQASKDVIPSIIILLSIIVVLFSVFVFFKWKLYPESGYILFAAYGLFVVYQLLNTYVINKDQKTCTYLDDKCC